MVVIDLPRQQKRKSTKFLRILEIFKMAESIPSTSATTDTISAPVTTAEDYFEDDLDDVIINFVPDELVQSIINGTI